MKRMDNINLNRLEEKAKEIIVIKSTYGKTKSGKSWCKTPEYVLNEGNVGIEFYKNLVNCKGFLADSERATYEKIPSGGRYVSRITSISNYVGKKLVIDIIVTWK